METTEGKKEVITEVTSVAEEEKKTGQKIEVPPEKQLIEMASASHINSLVRLEQEFTKLSGRGKSRALIAILAMPTDGIPVRLQSDNEKLCFALGQRVIADRFILTQYHINQEVMKQKAEREKAQAETPEKKKETETENE